MKHGFGTLHCYINLAAAICASGINQNDIEFLNSEWYKFLKSYVEDYTFANNNNKGISVNIQNVKGAYSE